MAENINIQAFGEQFDIEYDFLYDHEDRVAGYEEAVEAFDTFLANHGDFVRVFAEYRGDCITSDREAAAFMFALYSLAA